MVWCSEQCCKSESSKRIPNLTDVTKNSDFFFSYGFIISLHDLTWCYRVARLNLFIFITTHPRLTPLGEFREMQNPPYSNFNLTLLSSTQESKERSEKDIVRRNVESCIYFEILFVYLLFFQVWCLGGSFWHISQLVGTYLVMCCSSRE